jgi:hypothetical protein
MDRVRVEANVKRRFTEHDLRAKIAGDAPRWRIHVRYSTTTAPAPQRARTGGPHSLLDPTQPANEIIDRPQPNSR